MVGLCIMFSSKEERAFLHGNFSPGFTATFLLWNPKRHSDSHQNILFSLKFLAHPLCWLSWIVCDNNAPWTPQQWTRVAWAASSVWTILSLSDFRSKQHVSSLAQQKMRKSQMIDHENGEMEMTPSKFSPSFCPSVWCILSCWQHINPMLQFDNSSSSRSRSKKLCQKFPDGCEISQKNFAFNAFLVCKLPGSHLFDCILLEWCDQKLSMVAFPFLTSHSWLMKF